MFFTLFTIANAQTKDVTQDLLVLGKPFNKASYANNVWDMLVYNNRIYFGHGNSSNTGPSRNAGPIPIISYDLEYKSFLNSGFSVDDEQIDIFRIIGGQLYIPGHDPTSGNTGNFYRLNSNDEWEKTHNIPGAYHVYDLYEKDNRLFAGLGAYTNNIYVSDDLGATWQACPEAGEQGVYRRRYNFLEVGNTLFNVYSLYMYDLNNDERIFEYDVISKKWIDRPDLTYSMVFPDIGFQYNKLRVVRPVVFQNKTLYVSGLVVNDHQWMPLGLHCATSFKAGNVQCSKVVLPDENSIPWDILVRDQVAYLLLSEKIEEAGQPDVYRIRVAKSTDGTNWETLFSLDQPTFARSFEEHNGDFYLGLGTDVGLTHSQLSYTDGIANETGTVIKVPREAYTPVIKSISEVNLSQIESYSPTSDNSILSFDYYIEVESHKEHELAINNNDYVVTVYELSENMELINSHRLRNGYSFITADNTVFLEVEIQDGMNANVTLEDHVAAFEAGLTIELTPASSGLPGLPGLPGIEFPPGLPVIEEPPLPTIGDPALPPF